MVDVFERKILRRIDGLTKNRDNCRCWFSRGLYGLVKEPRFSGVIRITGLRWAGRVTRMDEICMPRRLGEESYKGSQDFMSYRADE
jgi:hypothetical protein